MALSLRELRGPIHALFSDVDGTLTTNHRVEASTYAALEALGESGVPVVLVTGRPAGWGQAFMSVAPVAAVVITVARGRLVGRHGHGLTKSIALHAARAGHGVRCNSIHPSFIDTPMVDRMAAVMGDQGKARLEHAAPLGRLGHVDDVTAMILYLASDESRFVTGAELAIDGGLTAR